MVFADGSSLNDSRQNSLSMVSTKSKQSTKRKDSSFVTRSV